MDHGLKNMTSPASNVYVRERETEFLDEALRFWSRAFEESLRLRGRFCAALSGGQTPVPFYRELARQTCPDSGKKVHLFLVDERFGPPDHPASNGRMIAEILVRPTAFPAENFHPIPLNLETAEQSALWYERDLREFFHLQEGEFPIFDFILLGIGRDGHTASLFPGTSAIEEARRAVAAVNFNRRRPDRVTLTLPVLNLGKEVVFLIQGEEKAEIVHKVIAERDYSLPAARIQPRSGELTFLIDVPAGKMLPPGLQRRRSPS